MTRRSDRRQRHSVRNVAAGDFRGFELRIEQSKTRGANRSSAKRGQSDSNSDRGPDQHGKRGSMATNTVQMCALRTPASQWVTQKKHPDAHQKGNTNALANHMVELLRRKLG